MTRRKFNFLIRNYSFNQLLRKRFWNELRFTWTASFDSSRFHLFFGSWSSNIVPNPSSLLQATFYVIYYKPFSYSFTSRYSVCKTWKNSNKSRKKMSLQRWNISSRWFRSSSSQTSFCSLKLSYFSMSQNQLFNYRNRIG